MGGGGGGDHAGKERAAEGPLPRLADPPLQSRGATVAFWPRDPLPSALPGALRGAAPPVRPGVGLESPARDRSFGGSFHGGGRFDGGSFSAGAAAVSTAAAAAPWAAGSDSGGLDPTAVERVVAAVAAQLPFPLAPALLRRAVVAALARLSAAPPPPSPSGNGGGGGGGLDGVVEAAAAAELALARGGRDDEGASPLWRPPRGSPYLAVDPLRGWPLAVPPARSAPSSSKDSTAGPPNGPTSGDSTSRLQAFAWGARAQPPPPARRRRLPAASAKLNRAEAHRLQRQQLLLQPLLLHADADSLGEAGAAADAAPELAAPAAPSSTFRQEESKLAVAERFFKTGAVSSSAVLGKLQLLNEATQSLLPQAW
jgi:hypothetical protein